MISVKNARAKWTVLQLMVVVAFAGLGLGLARLYADRMLERRAAVLEKIQPADLGPEQPAHGWNVRIWLSDPFHFAAFEGSVRCICPLLALGLIAVKLPDLIGSRDHLRGPGTAASFAYVVIVVYQIAGFAASLALGPGVGAETVSRKWTELIDCLGSEVGGGILAVWAILLLLRLRWEKSSFDWIESLGVFVGIVGVSQAFSAAVFKAIRLSVQ